MSALDFFRRKKLGHLREKPQPLRKQREKKTLREKEVSASQKYSTSVSTACW